MDATEKITKNLGGNRLGSGDKNNISMHAYNRSTHDLSRAWRSSMNVGTLVPFFKEVALNGDTWEINLNEIVRTIPSIGPLYGSYKLQMDMFSCPMRLYNGLLHNNMLNIGMNMKDAMIPKMIVSHKMLNPLKYKYEINGSQIANDALLAYLGVRGLADVKMSNEKDYVIERELNAIPVLAYWDIYKNYYANKQERYGYYIIPKIDNANPIISTIHVEQTVYNGWALGNSSISYELNFNIPANSTPPGTLVPDGDTYQSITNGANERAFKTDEEWSINLPKYFNLESLKLVIVRISGGTTVYDQKSYLDIFPDARFDEETNILYLGHCAPAYESTATVQQEIKGITYDIQSTKTGYIDIRQFDLTNIDQARMDILRNTGLGVTTTINQELDYEPYTAVIFTDSDGTSWNSYHQNGLGLKTYQSDLFNNWIQTEWIDGNNGINAITAVDTSSGTFTIDALNLANKVYNMLNRIAVSGGTYEDWQEAVYSTEATRRAETPIYVGGMSAEIVFEEVVSTASAEQDGKVNPLGTLGGKGTITAQKGGHVEIRVDEPSYIIGIVSITPRIDYSQGNDWDMTELDSIDDLHKPALDGIGFENLLQERMAWWGTFIDPADGEMYKLAAGKVPAWINYMTSVNKTFGDFADVNRCMYMTLNRRYEYRDTDDPRSNAGIADMTTYVNPTKYNYCFADSSLEAQNFWVQIGMDVKVRRVMSAKMIPNL